MFTIQTSTNQPWNPPFSFLSVYVQEYVWVLHIFSFILTGSQKLLLFSEMEHSMIRAPCSSFFHCMRDKFSFSFLFIDDAWSWNLSLSLFSQFSFLRNFSHYLTCHFIWYPAGIIPEQSWLIGWLGKQTVIFLKYYKYF